MKQRKNKVPVLLSFFGVVLVTVIGVLFKKDILLVQPIDDPILSSKITAYMEQNSGTSIEQDEIYINGVLNYDNCKVYCENIIYGYDSQYVYAWVFCGEYSWRYLYNKVASYYDDGRVIPDDNRPIKITRELYEGAYWSAPIRLEYKSGSDFEFIGHKEPNEGMIDIERLFPMDIHTAHYSNTKADMRSSAKQRFHAEKNDAPMPNHIDEIYGIKNPQIVY